MQPIRVAQLNAYIKRVLQTDPVLGDITVIGEISNLKFHGTGHVYFTLKDQNSKLNCFLPSDVFRTMEIELSEGLEIIARGYINLFEKGGTYSLNIRQVRVEGVGNLAQAFERLKEKLSAEGLFDQKYKKPIPAFPKTVAVVTSDTGAALQDIIKIITSRNDYVDIIVCPVQVQGFGAAPDIAAGIRKLNNKYPHVDCMIVGRGGGSSEELWAFNEEIVARSIFESDIPVISAVGHQTDFTIADFAADVRAETPSAAAHLAAPDLELIHRRLKNLMSENSQAMRKYLEYLNLRVSRCDKGVAESLIKRKIEGILWRIQNNMQALSVAVNTKLENYGNKLELQKTTVESLNPLSILNRGYSILEDDNGQLITSVNQLSKGESLRAVLKDGSADLTVEDINESKGEKRPEVLV